MRRSPWVAGSVPTTGGVAVGGKTDLADLGTLSIGDGLTADEAAITDCYALIYDGYVEVDTDGYYGFWVTSDDGSTLEIGGVTVVDNDGPHGAIPRAGGLWLRVGTYPLRLRFFESRGGQALSLGVAVPTGAMATVRQMPPVSSSQ